MFQATDRNGDLRCRRCARCQDELACITCYKRVSSTTSSPYVGWQLLRSLVVLSAYAFDGTMTFSRLERFPEPNPKGREMGLHLAIAYRTNMAIRPRCSSTRACGRPCGGRAVESGVGWLAHDVDADDLSSVAAYARIQRRRLHDLYKRGHPSMLATMRNKYEKYGETSVVLVDLVYIRPWARLWRCQFLPSGRS